VGGAVAVATELVGTQEVPSQMYSTGGVRLVFIQVWPVIGAAGAVVLPVKPVGTHEVPFQMYSVTGVAEVLTQV
jgi:hypothetical protein